MLLHPHGFNGAVRGAKENGNGCEEEREEDAAGCSGEVSL